jgi:hypothetical protein
MFTWASMSKPASAAGGHTVCGGRRQTPLRHLSTGKARPVLLLDACAQRSMPSGKVPGRRRSQQLNQAEAWHLAKRTLCAAPGLMPPGAAPSREAARWGLQALSSSSAPDSRSLATGRRALPQATRSRSAAARRRKLRYFEGCLAGIWRPWHCAPPPVSPRPPYAGLRGRSIARARFQVPFPVSRSSIR